MDQKPIKLHGVARLRDENATSQLASLKTLHQRNKSTSALNTISLKPIVPNLGPRRALADVSTTRNVAKAQDDLSFAPKTSLLEAKPLRPIQPSTKLGQQALEILNDPARSSALRSEAYVGFPLKRRPVEPIYSNVVASASTSNSLASFEALPAKTLVKRHTTIFRETLNPSEIKTQAAPRSLTVAAIADSAPLPTLAPVAAVQEAKVSEPIQSYPSAISTVLPNHPLPHVPIPTATQSVVPRTLPDMPIALSSLAEPELYLPALETLPSIEPHIAVPSSASTMAPVEEYWEEDDEEYFDAEGCVTGRSLRSMGGDNTTGGMSIVLAPKVTAAVQAELAVAKDWVDKNTSLEELEDESWDATMVQEYAEEIFDYFRELETRMMPNPYYMENQAEIQWSMRSVLIDWVVQVHSRFTMLPETLFLAVNCIDRFLTVKVVSIAKLQLVGATAIYVAAKYEEINCPSVQEVAFMVDGSYTQEEILKAERFMLTMLKFEMGWPGPMSFLRRISKADEYDVDTRTVAKYFLEVTLMDERFVGCTPSFLAAGAHCLARLMLRKGDWTQGHVHYSQFTFAQLRPLMAVILECVVSPTVHHPAVHEKYMSRQLKRVSQYVKGEMELGFKLPGAAKRESAAAGAWLGYRDISRRKWDGARVEENMRPAVAV